MSRTPLIPLLVVAIAAAGHAQTADRPVLNNAAATPATRAADTPPRRAPSVMASRLAANAPKFTAPTPEAAAAPAPAPLESDTPRNQIYRLPPVMVQEYRQRFKERQILTPEEKIQLAFKKYPALQIGNAFGLNRTIAEMAVDDAERLQRKAEMTDLTSILEIASPEEAKRMKSESWRAYMRPPDFGRYKGAQGSNQRLGPFFDRVVD